jgi:hypothetical protein
MDMVVVVEEVDMAVGIVVVEDMEEEGMAEVDMEEGAMAEVDIAVVMVAVVVDTNRNNKGMGDNINITMNPEAVVVVVVDTVNLINPNTTRMVVVVAVADLPMVAVAVVDLLTVAAKVRSIHAQNYTWGVSLAKRVSPLMTFRNDPVVTYKSIRMFHPDKTVKLPSKGRDLVLKLPSKCFPKSYRWVPIIPMLGVVEVEVVAVVVSYLLGF